MESESLPSSQPEIMYRENAILHSRDILDLYRSAPLPEKALFSEERIASMFTNSNLVISAWDGELLVAVARCLTDHEWNCYVSDLAIRKEYQKGGIGRELLRKVKECVGDCVSVILLSRPETMAYYAKIGFTKIENGFTLKRTREQK